MGGLNMLQGSFILSVKTLLVKNALIHSEAVNHGRGVQQEGTQEA